MSITGAYLYLFYSIVVLWLIWFGLMTTFYISSSLQQHSHNEGRMRMHFRHERKKETFHRRRLSSRKESNKNHLTIISCLATEITFRFHFSFFLSFFDCIYLELCLWWRRQPQKNETVIDRSIVQQICVYLFTILRPPDYYKTNLDKDTRTRRVVPVNLI